MRHVSSELLEIIGSSLCPDTAATAELDNLPVVTCIDLFIPSMVHEDPSKFLSLPWENRKSVSPMASSNNNDQALLAASEFEIVCSSTRECLDLCEASFELKSSKLFVTFLKAS